MLNSSLTAAYAMVCILCEIRRSLVAMVYTYDGNLCSFRIRILTPWSQNVRERKVASVGPGYRLGRYTVNASDSIVFLFSTVPL